MQKKTLRVISDKLTRKELHIIQCAIIDFSKEPIIGPRNAMLFYYIDFIIATLRKALKKTFKQYKPTLESLISKLEAAR